MRWYEQVLKKDTVPGTEQALVPPFPPSRGAVRTEEQKPAKAQRPGAVAGARDGAGAGQGQGRSRVKAGTGAGAGAGNAVR